MSSPFAAACTTLEGLLSGEARTAIVASVGRPSSGRKAFQRLRESLRAHEFEADGHVISLADAVRTCDRRTRQDGLHVLHDWDGRADHINEQMIPVEVCDLVASRRGDAPTDPFALAVLLDYYLLHVLGLLSMRLWDEGTPDENLDRLEDLLARLQGSGGSRERFVSGAATLLLLATSHYERGERGYDRLLAQVRLLDLRHRVAIALGHAAALGCHLRFGFEATYGHDIGRMRDDNVADYPWLSFALATLMDEFDRMAADEDAGARRALIAEALLNGLACDPRAMFGATPACLAGCDAERQRFATTFARHRETLLQGFAGQAPTADAYTPLAFFFNFSQNVVKGRIVDTLLRGVRWTPTLDDLFTGLGSVPPSSDRAALATTLMAYARANPDRIRGRLMPVIVYDPLAGRRAWRNCLDVLRGVFP